MNLLPLLLGFVLLGTAKSKDKKNGIDLSSLLSNQDALTLLPHVAKLFDKSATEDDKNSAVINLMSNPIIFELMQKFFVNQPSQEDKQPSNENQDKQTHSEPKNENENNEIQKDFSQESKDFFKPIENVAGAEISQKLYSLYDNWYIKK